jgi:hypothetical protein
MEIERVRHRLGAAVQLVDAFTAKAIQLPLDVRADKLPAVIGMPRLPWRAVRSFNDDTYRFFVTGNQAMPAGNIAVTIVAPGQEYVDFEPMAMVLPRPLVAHPPTPARSDFRVEHPLWPTRSLALPPGETAIVARCVSGGITPIGALKITIWPAGAPQPAVPYTYTTDRGEFVYRLPDLKTVNGGVISTTASLDLNIRTPPAYVGTVVPTQIRTDLGVVIAAPFAVPLGRVTNLTITLP